MERTYIMLKPDAYEKKIYGEIIKRIEKENFKIVNMKMMKLTPEILKEHYAHLVKFDFFPELLNFMLSGPVLAIIVEGENAIARMRELMGPTKNAKVVAPESIRGMFGDPNKVEKNVIHGSDGKETAKQEIERFFGKEYEL